MWLSNDDVNEDKQSDTNCKDVCHVLNFLHLKFATPKGIICRVTSFRSVITLKWLKTRERDPLLRVYRRSPVPPSIAVISRRSASEVYRRT